MNKLYVVNFEIVDGVDCDTEFGILGKKYYTSKDDARKAMLHDFDMTKMDKEDGIDDIDESHSIDGAFLGVNDGEWYENWIVEEIEIG